MSSVTIGKKTMANKRVIIVGGGASIKEGLQLGLWDKISTEEVWSINFAYKTMPYLPKREVWVDISFFKSNMNSLFELSQKGVPCYAKKHNCYADIPEIRTYDTTREITEPKKLFIGKLGLSGFFALQLAVLEQYSPIYLLGYDFRDLNNQTHYYQGELVTTSVGVGHKELYIHKDGTPKETVKDFNIFQDSPSKIYNVSPQSHIPTFEKIDYPTFFNQLNENK